MISSFKLEYSRKEEVLAKTQEEADRAKKDAEALRSRQSELIEEKALEVINRRKNVLEGKYRFKTGTHKGFLIGCLLYGLLVTALEALKSECFMSDFVEFFSAVWSGICWIAKEIYGLGLLTAGLGDKIQNPTGAVIVHWVLLILVVGGIGALLTALLSWCVVQVVKFYKDDYADEISLAEVLITFAVAVFFAEPIRSFIPLNMLVILLVVHAAYIGVRYLIMKD